MLLRASLTTIAKLVAASSLVLSAATAKAALVTLTFSGTITSGLDKLNLFETSTTDLTGSAYIQTLSFNTDDLNIVWQTPYSYAEGFDNKQIKANGSVSVNHHTYTWTSDIALGSLAFSAQVVHGGGDEFQMRADVYKNIEDNFTSGVYLNSVTSSFVGSADPTQSHTFNGDLSSFAPLGYFTRIYAGSYTNFLGDLSEVRYQVSSVPEPTELALFTTGLVALALIQRRKNKSASRSDKRGQGYENIFKA